MASLSCIYRLDPCRWRRAGQLNIAEAGPSRATLRDLRSIFWPDLYCDDRPSPLNRRHCRRSGVSTAAAHVAVSLVHDPGQALGARLQAGRGKCRKSGLGRAPALRQHPPQHVIAQHVMMRQRRHGMDCRKHDDDPGDGVVEPFELVGQRLIGPKQARHGKKTEEGKGLSLSPAQQETQRDLGRQQRVDQAVHARGQDPEQAGFG